MTISSTSSSAVPSVVSRNFVSILLCSMEKIKNRQSSSVVAQQPIQQQSTHMLPSTTTKKLQLLKPSISSSTVEFMARTMSQRINFSTTTPSLLGVGKQKFEYNQLKMIGNRHISGFLQKDNSFRGLEEIGEGTELSPEEVIDLVKKTRSDEYSECIFLDVRGVGIALDEGTIDLSSIGGEQDKCDGKEIIGMEIPLVGSDADSLDDSIQDFLSKLDEFEDEGKVINLIVYCNKGEWSYDFARYLTRSCIDSVSLEDGYVKLYLINGGYERWKREGYPTIEHDHNVHQG